MDLSTLKKWTVEIINKGGIEALTVYMCKNRLFLVRRLLHESNERFINAVNEERFHLENQILVFP